jgi:hypothetical protein
MANPAEKSSLVISTPPDNLLVKVVVPEVDKEKRK